MEQELANTVLEKAFFIFFLFKIYAKPRVQVPRPPVQVVALHPGGARACAERQVRRDRLRPGGVGGPQLHPGVGQGTAEGVVREDTLLVFVVVVFVIRYNRFIQNIFFQNIPLRRQFLVTERAVFMRGRHKLEGRTLLICGDLSFENAGMDPPCLLETFTLPNFLGSARPPPHCRGHNIYCYRRHQSKVHIILQFDNKEDSYSWFLNFKPFGRAKCLHGSRVAFSNSVSGTSLI